MTIIADTGALYACYDRSDAHHRAATAYLGGLDEPPWVPALVLAELDHLVGARLGERARATVLDDVLDTATVIPFNQSVAVRSAGVAGVYPGSADVRATTSVMNGSYGRLAPCLPSTRSAREAIRGRGPGTVVRPVQGALRSGRVVLRSGRRSRPADRRPEPQVTGEFRSS